MYGDPIFDMTDEEYMALGQLPDGGDSWSSGFGWGQKAGKGLGDAFMQGNKAKSLKGRLSGGGVPAASPLEAGGAVGMAFGSPMPGLSMSDME